MIIEEVNRYTKKSTLLIRQEALIKMLEEQYQDRSLFHLVLTYKPYQDVTYDEKLVNKYFTTFYLRHFLPYLMNSRNYHRASYRSIQPICLAFVDDHEHSPITNDYFEHDHMTLGVRGEYSESLHHHAIVAIRHEHLDRMNGLIGTNTLVGTFSYKVMTSFIRPCDANTLKYASKRMMRFQDYLVFPDRINTK